MKKLLLASILGTALTLGAVSLTGDAFADGSKTFKSTISVPTGAIKINVSLSDDLVYRANHMSKDLKYRSRSYSVGGYRNGFIGHGFYGDKDLAKLTTRLKTKMEAQLVKQGIEVNEQSANVLNIVLTDVSSTRPTFNQMRKSHSLSMQSFGIGGAEFSGTLVVNGETSGDISYAWYESSIRNASYGGTWTDTHRAIEKFAKKTAKTLR